jgi:hypothetical protein
MIETCAELINICPKVAHAAPYSIAYFIKQI